MPKEGENILKFNNFHKQQAVPFVKYADFEAITKKVQGCKPNDDNSKTGPIRLMKTVAMDTKSYVAIRISIVNQFKHIRVKMPFTNSWKRCLKKLSTVKVLSRKGLTNH